MKVSTRKPPTVYIEIRDSRRRRKSACLTVEGFTPAKAKKFFAQAVREHLRKAS